MTRFSARTASATAALIAVFVLALSVSFGNALAGAQYGGVSGFFVTTSPSTPGFADFSGLGCAGGHEVVLYIPGIPPTSSDPVASQRVPGRIIAVGTTISSADALLDGTFTFTNVRLPTDVEPGVYEVRARCGNLDMRVLIQIDSDGSIRIDPDPDAPVINETPGANGGAPDGVGGSLPLTGRESSRIVSLGAGIVGAGLALLAASRRSTRAAS